MSHRGKSDFILPDATSIILDSSEILIVGPPRMFGSTFRGMVEYSRPGYAQKIILNIERHASHGTRRLQELLSSIEGLGNGPLSGAGVPKRIVDLVTQSKLLAFVLPPVNYSEIQFDTRRLADMSDDLPEANSVIIFSPDTVVSIADLTSFSDKLAYVTRASGDYFIEESFKKAFEDAMQDEATASAAVVLAFWTAAYLTRKIDLAFGPPTIAIAWFFIGWNTFPALQNLFECLARVREATSVEELNQYTKEFADIVDETGISVLIALLTKSAERLRAKISAKPESAGAGAGSTSRSKSEIEDGNKARAASAAGTKADTDNGQSSGADQAPVNRTKPCDVQTLKVEILPPTPKPKPGSKPKPKQPNSVSVSSQRRIEKVADNVPDAYRHRLVYNDLIIEILAPVEETDSTYHWGEGGKKEAAKGHEPTMITATATPNSSCGETHPALSANGASVNKSSAREPMTFNVFASKPSAAGSNYFSRIWPFTKNRTEEIVVKADSCGILPGGEPNKNLEMLLVLIPDRIHKLTLGLGTYASGSASKSQESEQRNLGLDRDEVGYVVAYKRQRGNSSRETKTTYTNANYVAGTKLSEEFVTSDSSGVVFRDTETVTNTPLNETLIDQKREKKTTLRKIKYEQTVGGQTSEADVSKFLNNALKLMEDWKKIRKILDGIPKVGWSFDVSFSFLKGQAVFEGGYKWPRSFAEDNRVYYVDRFLTMGGDVELAALKFEVFFGVEVDPWWAPVYFVAKLYLEYTMSVSIAPSATWTAQNWKGKDLDFNPIKIETTAEAKFDLGATAGGEVAGHALKATLKMEGDITFDMETEVNREGPETKVKVETKGVHVIGEIIVVGRTRKKYDFDPIKVIKPQVIFPKST